MERPGQIPELPAQIQASAQRVIPSAPGDYFVVLKNGMTVLVRQNNEYDVVSAQVFVRAGSIYEGEFLTAGLSHYLEHVVAGGTTRSFTEAEAKETLKELGGASNAYTSFDRTVYYINTSSEHWNKALKLLLSYVSENTLDPREVTREKAVIQQEYKLGENDASRELWKLFMNTAYRVHPAQYPVIGYEDVFVQQTRDDLQKYYAERYVPQNMVVVVAGKVDPFAVLQAVIDGTKDFPRKAEEPIVLPAEPAEVSSQWSEKEHPIAQLTQAMVGFPSVDITHPDLYALDVLAILLGDGDTSRLNQRLKEKEKQVLSVDASNWTPAFVRGQFFVSMDLSPQNWPGVLGSLEDEINGVKKDLVAPEELERAKKKVIAAHVFGKETVSAMASSLASSYFDTGDPYFDDAYVESIRRVTAEDVRRAAQLYLDMNRLNVAVLKPVGAGEAEAQAPPSAQTAPQQATAPSSEASTVNYSRMDNGLKLLLKPDHALPFVNIQLYGLGGLALEKSYPPGISAFTAGLLTAGTRNRTKNEIAQAIEGVGGDIGSSSENNTYHINIKVLKEDVDLALDILADIVQNAQFPAEEIEKRRQDTLLAIQRRDENWQAEVARLFKKSYFKEHPYEHDRLGTPESVGAFTQEDLLKFYRYMVVPNRAVLTVYGDVGPDAVRKRIGEKFSSWQASSNASVPELPNETRPLDADRVVEKKNQKTSAALFIGTDGLDISDKERPALDVLDAILSGIGYPTGRLEDALRGGDLDLVYLVHAFPSYGINAGFFGVITQTTMGNMEKVQNIILQNLRRMSEQPVSQQELEMGKNMLATMHHMEMESLGAQAQNAAVNEVLGLGWDYDERYLEQVKTVTVEDVQNIAKKLFAHTLIVRTIPENPVEIITPTTPERHIHPATP
jgi:zinc protease